MKKTKPPLIAHIIFKLGTGGLENGLVNLINNIPQDKYRHAVICMTNFTEFRNRIERKDTKVYCLNKKEGNDFAALFRLWSVLRGIKPDILHTRNLSGIEAQLPGFFAGIKTRIHGEHGRDMDDLDGKHFRYTLLRRIFRLLIQRYIPMSKDLEKWLVQDIRVSEGKVSQIYNGVDVTRFRPALVKSLKILPEWLKKDSKFILGSVGRQEPVKDPVTLLEAFIHLVKNFPELGDSVKLIMVGDGTLNPILKNMVKNAEIERLVWFAGDRSDIPEILQTLDLFVLPSVNEGISNTILEAMATGLPVIATNVGGNPELVLDKITGSLVSKQNTIKMADALKFYIDNPEATILRGQNARQRILEKFSLKRMVDAYMKVYEQAETSV